MGGNCMRGLVKVAPGEGNMELRDLEPPKPGPGQVLIEVKYAGICGSDLHIYHWDIGHAMKPPMVIGHEFSGVIVELGKDVEGWKVGDRVTAEPSAIICGSCRYCRTGAYNLCAHRKIMGYWVDGVFAEYVVVGPTWRLHKLPELVSFEEGALTEPLACCVHAVYELTGVEVGDFVVITGPGAIGLLTAQLAKAEGAEVMLLGTRADQKRLAVARELGGDHCITIEDKNPVELVKELTEGYGADTVFECSGVEAAVSLGIEIVRKQGKYTQVGLFGKPIRVDFERLAYKELKVTGSMAQRYTAWKRTLKIMELGKVNLKTIISDIMPLSQWKRAFEKFEKKDGLKVLLNPKE